MNLTEMFEQLNLDRHLISPEDLYATVHKLTDEQIQQQITLWLTSLDRYHQVPGKTVGKMLGICDVALRDIPLSHKQRIYAVATLITYWDQMSAEARARILL
jgi:hypothetical protein